MNNYLLVQNHSKTKFSLPSNYSKIEFGNYTFYSQISEKFKNDCLLTEKDEVIYFIEGVIFNKEEFITCGSNWKDSYIKAFSELEMEFIKSLRGSFSGFVYNKKTNNLNFFVDQISSKPVFYFKNENEFIISNSFNNINIVLEKIKIKKNLSIKNAKQLLSFGYNIDSGTLIENLFLIKYGSHLISNEEEFSVQEYFSFSYYINNEITFDDAIEKVDLLFRQAIKRQFEKDKEYKLDHFATLSGGLDSRMTSLVAHSMGYIKQLNATMSESNTDDQNIAMKIASDYHHEWIFKSLDNGDFLMGIDNIIKFTGGNVVYSLQTFSNFLFKSINFSNFGILHSGQIGDITLSTKNLSNELNYRIQAPFTDVYVYDDKFPEFKNQDDFLIQSRFINANLFSLIVTQQFSETFSPFQDIDFWSFCISLPKKYKYNHKIYLEWVSRKYPDAADYIWQTSGRKINSNSILDKSININDKNINLYKIYKYLKRKLYQKLPNSKNSREMTPLDYWYNNNDKLRQFYNKSFEENIHLLDNYPQLLEIANKYRTERFLFKSMVLTLLKTMEKFNIN